MLFVFKFPASFVFAAEADLTETFKACVTWTQQTCADFTSTPGSCCLLDSSLSGCQPASLFLCHWMFLGQVWTMSPLFLSRLTYSFASLKWQSRWRGKYQEEDKKPEISFEREWCIERCTRCVLNVGTRGLKGEERTSDRWFILKSYNYPLKLSWTINFSIRLKVCVKCTTQSNTTALQ